MAEIRLTEEQKRAIGTPGSMLVGAGAGSGKTFVLTERIARMLSDRSDPIPASRILVLTFSRAAAREMKQKIRRRLAEMIAADPGDRHLREQQKMLRRTHIGTVHSFCSKILREFFSEAGISPDFKLASDDQSRALRTRALEQTMDTLSEEDPVSAGILAGNFGRSRSDREAMEAVRSLYEFEQNLTDPSAWEAKALRQTAAGSSFEGSGAAGEASEVLCEQFREMLSLVNRAEYLFSLEGSSSKAYKNFCDLRDHCAQMMSLLEKGDLAGASSKAGEKPYSGNITVPKTVDADTAKKVRAAKDVYKDLLEKTVKMISEELGESNGSRERQADVSAALIKAVNCFSQIFSGMKRDRAVLEYDDLELLTIRLFYKEDGSFTDIAGAVAERYDAVLVDEFQDTNERQKLIFDAVSSGGKDLFCVGDVKQSIYSFRKADPSIFIGMKEKCGAEGGPVYQPLNSNFRSDERVINAVNSVFSPLMTPGFGGTDYSNGDCLVHDSGRIDTDNGAECGIEYHSIDCDSDDLPGAVAGYIAGILKSGYRVADGEGTRPVREEDICILLRSMKGRAGKYADALEKAGIRYSSSSSQDYFESYEIMVVMSLLRAVSNPARDIDLAAVMMSPVCGYTLDEFVRLRLKGGRERLWSTVKGSDDARSVRLRELIEGLRKKASAMSAEEIVREAVEDSEAEILLTYPPDTYRRRARLRALIEYAASYTAFGGGGLADFIRFAEAAAEKGNGPELPDSASSGVLITSVHKAKGLEWPVVVIADADRKFNTSGIGQSGVLFDQRAGMGSKIRVETVNGLWMDKTPEFGTISVLKTAELKEEELRILYVALTRAKQKAAVFAAKAGDGSRDVKKFERASSCAGTDGRLSPMFVSECSTFSDWIALAYGIAGFGPSDAGNGRAVRGDLMYVQGSPDDYAAEVQENVAAEAAADELLVSEIDRRVGFSYSSGGVVQIPTTLSVTQLTEASRPALSHRPEFVKKKGLTPAERGTALHEFMQHCDPDAALKDPGAEAQRLRDRQFLTEEAAASIDLDAVRAFFEGRLGKEILNADRIYREYSYMDSVPAIRVIPDVDPSHENDRIIIQGTADCVIEKGGELTILDYKTDRAGRPEDLLRRYTDQIREYSRSIGSRLGMPVREAVIWSFHLNCEVPVDLSAG